MKYQTIGLAPSAAAARELGKAGIESQTIASFNQREIAGLNTKTLLVVDEAGMVSAKDMCEILTKAEAANARVVLVGDVQQLKAIEAGKPFAQLQQAGVAHVEMGEIQRQHNLELRQSVELAARGDVARSLALLDKQIVEIDDHRIRHQTIAKEFAALPAEARDNTMILAGTHIARVAINENVRTELGLAGKGVDVSILARKDLTSVQARSSLSYQVGDMLQAQKNYPSLGMARGDFARVAEVTDGRVMLEHEDGKLFPWQPALQTSLTAYREEMRELSVGDVVRLTANQHTLGIINGERATITAIAPGNQTVTLLKADGNKITLDTGKPLHLDHGYCSTVHSAQGQTCNRVLIDADTRSATVNESSYYVAISRAREMAIIYTDDKTMLPEATARLDEKSVALDIAKEHLQQEPEMAL